MTGKTCMIKANTKEELDKIREQHPFVTTAYLKDGCPHCEGLKPVLEDECSKMNVLTVGAASPIATVHCPVTQDFCANELVQTVIDGYKDSKGIKGELSAKDKENIRVGVPLVIGKIRGIQKPAFVVMGNDQPRVRESYSVLREIVKKMNEKTNEAKANPVITNKRIPDRKIPSGK